MSTSTHKPTLFTRDFTLVVFGQIISVFGNSILRFALPLYLLRETGSAALFGIILACSILPMIVLSVLGGVLADRVNKRNIMVTLDFFTCLLVVTFSLLLGRSPLVPLMLATLLLLFGIQGAYQPTVQASVPALLDRSQVLAGSAVINQISALSNMVGPVAGGLLMSNFGIRPILIVSAACFLFSAVMELFIRIPYHARATEGKALVIVRKDLSESFFFIRKTKPILTRVMVITVLLNLFLSSMLTIGLPVIITGTLGLGDQLMGYCQGAMAAGALLGGGMIAVLGSRISIRATPTLLIVCALSILPVSLALLPGTAPMLSYGVFLAACIVLMAVATAASILLIAYVQTETPPELVGKVVSCLMAVSLCAQPIGQALYGLLFQYGAPWIITLGAAVASLLTGFGAKKAFRVTRAQTQGEG